MPNPSTAIDPTDASTWPTTCPTCGEALTKSRQCMGHKDLEDGTVRHCQRTARRGAIVCPSHGGNAPQVRAAAQRNLELAAARRTLATYGAPIDIEPMDAMLWLLRATAGHVAWLGALVAELEHQPSTKPAVMGDTDDREEGGGKTSSGRSGLKQYNREKGLLWEKPAVWVELYGQERDRLARVAKECLAAGIEERRVRVAEAQAQLIARAMLAFAERVGLDPAEERIRVAMRQSLTVVATEEAA